MKLVTVILSLFLALTVQSQSVLREGYIIKVNKPDSIKVVDRSGELTTLRPAKGNKFVVLNFILSEGRSLGKYDYVLKVGEKEFKCKLVGSNTEAFNEINWEFHVPSKLALRWKSEPKPALSGSRTVKEGAGVRLLFELNKNVKKAQLVYAIAPVGLKADEVSASSEIEL